MVVEAVLALDEPYRATIVARYYQGLDAEAIAAESGTTAATVRSREHRALEKLREKLDRRFPGERRAWAAVLARIAGRPARAPAGSPASAWPLALTATMPVLAAAVAGVFWLRSRSTPEPRVAASVAILAAGEQEPAALESALVPESPDEPRTPLGGEPAGSAKAAALQPAEIHGRFVFSGGAPAAGAAIGLHGWVANQERKMQHGEPAEWVDPRGETDADGRFALRFEPPRAFQFALDAVAPGRAQASWRWSEILPGARLDLGEVELPAGGTIEGRVVDSRGNALLGEEWLVEATTVGLAGSDGRDESRAFAVVDPATASFRLVDVWPCQVELRASSDMVAGIDGPTLAVRSGETVRADVVYSGPSNERRITVSTSTYPFHVMSEPAPEHVRLIGPAGEIRTVHGIEDSSQTYSFDDLPPGTYALEIDDPRYQPWSRAGLVPGEDVDARLEGSAALRLSVIDSAGRAVQRYAVRVTFRNVSFTPREFEVHDGESALAGGLVRGMFPGDYTVAIRCADGGTARCEVDGLASGETRVVRLELGSQVHVAGRVTYPDGAGVPGAAVLLLAPARQDDSDASHVLGPSFATDVEDNHRREIASTEVDAEGAFRMDVTRPGPFLLRARADGSQTFSPLFTLERARDDLALVLPRPGAVRGRVRAAAGASFEGLALWVAPSRLWTTEVPPGSAGLQRVEDMRESLAHALTRLNADGTFELAHLPPGPSRAFLVVAEAVADGFGILDDGISGAQRLDDLEVPTGDVLERDFDAPELPGWIEFQLRVNGQPAPFLEVAVSELEGRTDSAGRFGPKRVQTGTWTVWAHDPEAGWNGPFLPAILVEPGRRASAILDAQVVSGRITCVDGAERPIAGENVTLLRTDKRSQRGWYSPTRKTDANGRLELQLLPGEYLLQRGPYIPRGDGSLVPFTWTTSGPLVERVQL